LGCSRAESATRIAGSAGYISSSQRHHTALLDAMTNGGHGVAFFAPFENSRHFFPLSPIEVSPIGVSRFFSARGAVVVQNEMWWIWLPAATASAGASLFRRIRRKRAADSG
jgi:inner membrane protein